MKFRSARHTTDLSIIARFYQELVGLKLLGKFDDHDGYSGVFLGPENGDWELEFTESDKIPIHNPDSDDLLVFYLESKEEMKEVVSRIEFEYDRVEPINPYWEDHGVTFEDPEGYRLVIAMKPN